LVALGRKPIFVEGADHVGDTDLTIIVETLDLAVLVGEPGVDRRLGQEGGRDCVCATPPDVCTVSDGGLTAGSTPGWSRQVPRGSGGDYTGPAIDACSIQSHELEYRTAEVDEGDAVVAVSQSGETKDLLAALEDVDAPVLSFLNVAQSSLERRSDHTIYINAGPEVGVASTKAYTAQLAAMKTVASELKDQEQVANSLHRTAEKAEEVIETSESLAQELQSCLGGEDAYFVGRYQRFHSAKEASLKLKELSYIHSEAFPAGEFKHGTLALVEEGTPVVGFVDEETADETLSNLEEASSRGAEIIGVGPDNHDVYDLHIPTPEDPNREILEVIPFQMLALKAALDRGNDPDRPRNLAKSVTVK